MAKLKFNPANYQDLGAYALLKNIVENGHLVAEDPTPPTPPAYKVYTALLTQSGGDNAQNITGGDLTIGVTYLINGVNDADWTNVGAPNNNDGTYFMATGITPNSWGTSGTLNYNLGAPVVTVLENTIGNIWWTYESAGVYGCYSNGLFTIDKTWGIGDNVLNIPNGLISPLLVNVSNSKGANLPNYLDVRLIGGDENGDTLLNNTPIEIRVYN